MNSQQNSKKFKKEISSLGDIFEFTHPFYEQNKIVGETAYFVSLAIEEVFTNMVKYNTTSQNDIFISLEKRDGYIEAVLIDYDVEQFEPKRINEADMDVLREQGASGGRGVYLIHRVVDKLHYEYIDNNYIVRILKKTE